MIAIFYLALQILKIYSYVVIANVVISWLVAFNVLNTQNRFVYSISPKDTRVAPFLFWDNTITNNTFPTKTFRLGKTKIILRNANDDLLKNRKFTIYKDDEKIVYSVTDDNGLKSFYLPEGTYRINIPVDGRLSVNKKFDVSGTNITIFDYRVSTIGLLFRGDDDKAILNQKFSIYRPSNDVNNDIILGKSLGTYSTGDYGKINLLLPPNSYTIKLKGNMGKEYTLDGQELFDSFYKNIDYKLSYLNISFDNKSGDSKKDVLKGN